MQNVQYPQSIIGVIGKGAALVVRSTVPIRVEVLNTPDGMRPRTAEVTGTGVILLELAARQRVDSGTTQIRVTNTGTNEVEEIAIPTKVWGPRMSFVCLVQSSNVHIGWDPRPMAQYYRRDDDELVMYPGDTDGNHAWVHARKLERIFHKHNTPITWLIDDAVAEEQAAQIRDWHGEYGDAVAFLPRSFFYYNKRNYNLTSSTDELIDTLRPQVRALECSFAEHGWPIYCRTMGADQWVGSPGTRFVEAADALEFAGLWGIGYDHDTCDTSMYHKGTPWDVYKPRTGNFRVPGTGGSLWLFQWTTRDILNTSYFPARVGSTTFSTDADDIKYNGIPRFQNDYYARLLEEYRRNIGNHDVNVFLVHQEDHDSHIHESNRVLENFVDQVHDVETFATMDEITAWLNRRYTPEQHPYQLIEMNDPLTCHAEMKRASIAGDIPHRFAENAAWGANNRANPPHAAYYGTDSLWIIAEGSATPKIYYDYRKSNEYSFVEDGEYPTEQIPSVDHVSFRQERRGEELHLHLSFTSAEQVDALPVAVWNQTIPNLRTGRTAGIDTEGKPVTVWHTKNAIVFLCEPVVQGLNEITVTLKMSD